MQFNDFKFYKYDYSLIYANFENLYSHNMKFQFIFKKLLYMRQFF